jgi:cobalt-zinc-cadmium efflux system protein
VFFILIVGWITYEAVQRIMNPVEVMGDIMLLVAGLGLIVNLLAFFILHGAGDGDLNVRAALLHVLGDLLGSIAAISAAVIILGTGWMAIDPILSVFVAMLILRSAWMVVKESTHILLEGTPQDIDVDNLQSAIVEAIPCVRDVHHVHVWSLTPEHPLLTLHVNVDPDVDTTRVLQQVKKVLEERFQILHSTIQVEPAHCVDEHTDTTSAAQD